MHHHMPVQRGTEKLFSLTSSLSTSDGIELKATAGFQMCMIHPHLTEAKASLNVHPIPCGQSTAFGLFRYLQDLWFSFAYGLMETECGEF